MLERKDSEKQTGEEKRMAERRKSTNTRRKKDTSVFECSRSTSALTSVFSSERLPSLYGEAGTEGVHKRPS